MTIMEYGIEYGIEQGETINLMKLVYKKQQKGKSVSLIAEELEEEPILIKEIYTILEEYESIPDWREAYKQLKESPDIH